MDKIIEQLKTAGVTLFLKDSELRYRCLHGRYTPELKKLVDDNRQALIEYMAAQPAPAAPVKKPCNCRKKGSLK